MPRKSKKKPAEPAASKPTYHKSKNGRYYKKTTLPSGKCQCRFVSKKEAEAGLPGSSDKNESSKAKNNKGENES